jgi:hypothetical protein
MLASTDATIYIYEGDRYIAQVTRWGADRWLPVGYTDAQFHDTPEAAIEQARALRARCDAYWQAVATWDSPEQQVEV